MIRKPLVGFKLASGCKLFLLINDHIETTCCIDWDDKIDDDTVFDHIKCSISDNIKGKAAPNEEPPLKVIIRIYLTTSCITIQGLDHKWFSSSIFSKIKDMFNSLLVSSPATRATLSTSPAISPSQKIMIDLVTPLPLVLNNYKTPAPSRIPQPVSSVSPRQVRPKTRYLPQMDFANLE